jgi:hypothetical protein
MKCEPGDLARLLIPMIPESVQGAALTYRRAVNLLICGRAADARTLADAWLNGHLTAASTPVNRPRRAVAADKWDIAARSS